MKQMKQNVNIGHVIIHTLDVMDFGRVKMELMKLIVRLQHARSWNIVVSFQTTHRKYHVCQYLELVMEISIVLARQMSE